MHRPHKESHKEPHKESSTHPVRIIAIAGGPCSGKSSLRKILAENEEVVYVINEFIKSPSDIKIILAGCKLNPSMNGKVVIVDNIHALDRSLYDLCDMRIFMECRSHVALSRYTKRNGDGRSNNNLFDDYTRQLNDSEEFLEADERRADIVIPNSSDVKFEEKKVIEVLKSWISMATVNAKS